MGHETKKARQTHSPDPLKCEQKPLPLLQREAFSDCSCIRTFGSDCSDAINGEPLGPTPRAILNCFGPELPLLVLPRSAGRGPTMHLVFQRRLQQQRLRERRPSVRADNSCGSHQCFDPLTTGYHHHASIQLGCVRVAGRGLHSQCTQTASTHPPGEHFRKRQEARLHGAAKPTRRGQPSSTTR
jgi:hypothetical protein